MDLIRPDDETARRFAVSAIVLIFSGFALANTDATDGGYVSPVLGLLVGTYGAVLAIVPSARSRFDPNWLLTFFSISIGFVAVLAVASRVVLLD